MHAADPLDSHSATHQQKPYRQTPESHNPRPTSKSPNPHPLQTAIPLLHPPSTMAPPPPPIHPNAAVPSASTSTPIPTASPAATHPTIGPTDAHHDQAVIVVVGAKTGPRKTTIEIAMRRLEATPSLHRPPQVVRTAEAKEMTRMNRTKRLSCRRDLMSRVII